MSAEEVGGKERHFDNLDDVFSSRLRECSGSKSTSVPCPHESVPCPRATKGRLTSTSPPSSIRFVVLELPRDAERDENLEYSSLDAAGVKSAICANQSRKKNARHGCNHSEDSVTRIVPLQDPQELEESDHTEHSTKMRDSRHYRTEIRATTAKNRSSEEGDEEQRSENDGVEKDGTERDDGESEKTVDRRSLEGLRK